MAMGGWRDRLPSALAALALQGGFFALLALSFAVVRYLPAEKETIFYLPPLARPKPPPLVIDGRGAKKGSHPMLQRTVPSGTGEALAPDAATPAQGRDDGKGPWLRGFGQALADCVAGNGAKPTAAARAACPPPVTQRSDTDVLMHPNDHVADEDYWAAEKANSDAPFALPGAAAGPLGILLTALFNPSAFADKHAYSYGPPLPHKNTPTDLGIVNDKGMTGVTIQDPLCKLAGLLVAHLHCGAPPSSHLSTDMQFQAALDAVNARQGVKPHSLATAPQPATPQ